MSTYSIQYKVSTRDSLIPSNLVHITAEFTYKIGELYRVVIIFNSTHVTVSFNDTKKAKPWRNDIAPFVRYPKTVISLGGTDSLQNTTLPNFTGCITRLAVNDIEFPLNGLVGNKDPSVQIPEGSNVHTTCDLCQQETSPCPGRFNCVNYVDRYECECPTGTGLNEDGSECIPHPTPTKPAPLDSEATSATATPMYIFGAIGAGVVVIVIIFSSVACCVIYKRYRVRLSKKTYCVGGDNQLPHLGNGERSRPNSYTTVTKHSSSLGNLEPGYFSVAKDNHESSVSTTCNEHDIDEDNESNLQHMTRSKSSTSGETGFHTASERDERSIPRIDDSGNEKDSNDYSYDAESDDETQSYIEEHTTTANVRLRDLRRGLTLPPPLSSPSESSGPVSNLGEPLTPKEKKVVTPLRLDSRSELGEETDLDTDFSSTAFGTSSFAQGYRGGSLKLKERSGKVHGQRWYSVSTSSDTERERKRAEGNQVHFPQFRSFRSPRASSPRAPVPRAASTSPSQHIGVPHAISMGRKSSSPINEPHLQKSRPKRKTRNGSPPISPPTTYDTRTLPSRVHQKERDTRKTDASSGFSTSVLSRSEPLKSHPLFRQSSDTVRIPPHLVVSSYAPGYMRSYSEESRTYKGEKKFVDLGSVRTNCDPIQYWEGQRRMMATVDQVDGFQVLSESFTQFDDSATESQQSGPEHQSFSSQGGGEGTAEALDMGGILKLRDCDADSVATETTLKGSEAESNIMHFPSADCSEEYRCSSQIMPNVCTSSSGTNGLHKGFTILPSQGTFEV